MKRYFSYFIPNSSLLLVFLLTGNILFAQTTIVEWNFDNQDVYPSTYNGLNQFKTISIQGAGPTLDWDNNGDGGVSDYTIFTDNWDLGNGTKYWEIEVDLTGFDNILISSKQLSTSFGPTDFRIEYKVGLGGVWNPITGSNIVVTDVSWTGAVVDLSVPTDVDGQSSVFFRWIMTSDNSVLLPGFIDFNDFSYIDDITIKGSATINPIVNISANNNPISADIEKSSINNTIYRMDLAVTQNSLSVTGVTLTTQGTYSVSDFPTGGFKLWYSDDDVFDGGPTDVELDALDAVISGGDLVFSGFTRIISVNNTGYFFCTVDVGSNPTLSNTIGITATDFSNLTFIGSVTIDNPTEDPASAGNLMTIIDCTDNISNVFNYTQPTTDTTSSLNNKKAKAKPMMRFLFRDYINCDDKETKLTRIRLKAGTNNTSDWANDIQGLTLREYPSLDTIAISSQTITSNQIDLNLSSTVLTVKNAIKIVEVLAYLNTSGLSDGDVIQLFIDRDDHGWLTDPSGSGLLSTFAADINSNSFTISVDATELQFQTQPVNTDTYVPMGVDVSVAATDVNGNIDIDHATNISLSSTGDLDATPVASPVNGIAVFNQVIPAQQIIHNTGATSLQLTATSGSLTGTSGFFDINQTADRLAFLNLPFSGQVGSVITSFDVRALFPDDITVDLNYNGFIDIAVNTGPGSISSGTTSKQAISGVASFDDIVFDTPGNYTLIATSGTLTQDISSNIAIVGADESVFPNGTETMNVAITSPSSFSVHEAGNGFINTGVLTFSSGDVAISEADIRNTDPSDYVGASGGANVFFTSTSGDYGFAMEGIDASTYSNLTLQFAVRKENAAGTPFATLTVEYYDGNDWQPITVTDYPATSDGTGWKLLGTISLPVSAEITNLGLRWTKTGDYACRIDDVSLTGTPKAATNLIVATINGGLPPVVDVPFNVDIQVQDDSGSPANVLENTNVQLSLTTGTGTLGGMLTTTILAGTNSATISGVTYNTSETGVIISANRLTGDNLSSGNSSPFNVLAAEPTVSASALTIGTRTTTSIDISWTNGDGGERIVLAKQGASVDQDPVDGIVYTANADFTLGQDIGNGNIVVFAGLGNSVSITNLQPENTTYHFAIYEYNGAGGLQNYKQSDPATRSALTTCSDPSTQASALAFSGITQSSMDLSWTDGNGDGRIVIMNTSDVFTDPVDGDDTYTANPNWNNTGQQVVYFADGAGSSVTVTNLAPATTYYYRVYEYNCSGVDINYKTDVYNTASTDTYLFSQDFTSCPPAGWLNVRIAGDQDWTCAGDYVSASGLGSSAPSEIWYITPAINFNLIPDEKLSFDSWTSGTDDTHPKLFVMYSLDYTGSGNPYVATWDTLTFSTPNENSQSWTGSGPVDLSLINDNAAYLAFQYSSSGTSAGNATEWRIDNVQIMDQACVTPSVATTNLSYSNITQNSMTLNWTNGNGVGRLILIKEGSVVDFAPVAGAVYAASSDFSDPADPQITGGNKAIYSEGGSSVTVTGLNPGITYHYAVYEFNCDGANRTYIGTALIDSQSTLDPNASDIVENVGFSYPANIDDYSLYRAPNLTMTPSNSLSVFGLALRDGGLNGTNDGLSTTLTSISFSTNGSQAIRAAAIYDGSSLIGAVNVNGGTTFSIDLSSSPIVANDVDPGKTIDFELKVTFMQGDYIVDNEQIVFTVTNATADPLGSQFFQPDAGGAQSSVIVNENTIRVVADTLIFIQRPNYSLPINEQFVVEVEATDSIGSRDLNKLLTISNISGVGSLTSATNLTKSTGDSTAVWTDLMYDTAENTEFQVTDGEITPLTITTGTLIAKPRFTIFSFNGSSGDESSYPPDFQPVNVTISDIERGPNIAPSALSDAFSASSWPNPPSASFDPDSYYEITVAANTGYTIDIASVEFDHRRSGSGPEVWQIRNSLDSYTAYQEGAISGDGIWNRNQDVSYSIAGEDTVVFRIYAFNGSNDLGTWAVDNIEIFGAVTDVDPPAFTTGYPSSDSTAISGFDLVVNLTESATVYYVIQDPDVVLTAPDLNQVINGLNGDGAAAEVAGTIAVTAADSEFIQRIEGLNPDNIYDIYYVLYDGTYYSSVIPQTGLRTSDTNTALVATTQPAGPYVIPSTATTVDDLVDVFNFQISDQGTADGAPTHVTQLVFNAGSNNTVADWSTVIGGLILYNVTEDNYVAISNISIIGTSIIINFNPGNLSIADGSAEELRLSIHLTGTVTDNQDLEFTIGGDPHSNTTYTIGSQFSPALTLLTSNTYKIQVKANRLNILSHSASIPDINQDINLEVEAVDINGNRDVDETTDVVVRLGQFSQTGGEISTDPASDTLQSLGSGYATWNNINYNISGDFITIITHSNTLIDDTTGVIQIGSPADLIVTTTTTISSDLQVGNVDIQSTGNLTISPGVTLSLEGNFNVDGVLNGVSGTVDFNGTVQQQITGTSTPADFYNITVSNSAAAVIAEIDINLHNTLSMGASAVMDLDGAADNRNFTLVSTPTYTARIGQMGNGASLNGDVIWQRSLRTGPQGWRYIGTPIKNQTLASISDDVWIQGIAESYPNAWTNIATYDEPVGTEGQAGYEGWQDFTSNADNLNVGEGMKLWLWNIDYATEQVIQMKGQPFIGDGGDGVAGSTEDITLNTSFTSTAYDGGGWNFLANPYPSEIDWDLVIKDANINGEAVHVWNPNTQTYGSYSPLSGGISINGVTQYIASGQGFFVKAEAGGAFIRLSESSKATADGNSFLRISDEPLANIKVELSSASGKKDETAVTFSDLASDSYDSQFDVRKLGGGYVSLTTVIDEKQIAINAMGEKRGVQSVRLNIDSYVYGSFTMRFPQLEAFEDGATIRLVDKYLDKSKYINSASTYVFSIDENNPDTYGADRFEIQFVEPARFKFDQPAAKAGQEFIMPVFADKLEDIMNANMAVSWDKEALTFIGIEDTGMGDISNFNLSMVESGKLVYSDERMDPLSLPDGSQLFSIRFMAKNGMPQAQLRFEQTMMSLKAINNIDMPFSSEDVLIDILQNRFVSGAIATYSGELVNDVKITAQNLAETIEKTSNMDGSYALDTYEQSEYNVSAIKSTDGPLTEAITTLDIIKTRGHILGKEAFASPYQWIAADVNGSQTITAIDLVEMRKVILGIIPAFQSGLDWLIIPGSYDLSNNPFGYQTSVDIILTDQDIDLDFVGVKVGDVDNSWTNNDGSRRSKIDFALSMDHMFLDEDLIEIPVTVSQFSDIRGYQFTVTWDPVELQFYGADSERLESFFNEQMTDQGVLTTLWDELQGEVHELKEGDILMTLQFRALHEDAASEVAINSSVTPAVAFDSKLNAMSISASPVMVNLEELRNGSMELFQNVPNPFDFTTEIGFKLPKSGLVRLSIVNTLGEVIYHHEDNYTAGIYNISWDRNQGMRSVSPGVYLYRLESNGAEVVKKMVIK